MIFIWLLLAGLVQSQVFDTGFDLELDQPYDTLNFSYLSPDAYAKQNVIAGIPRDDSKGLSEFQPIRNTITESDLQLYSFAVNTSSGLGEYYQLLIFLTGNICSQPDNVKENETSLAVYYSFNSSMFSNFELGNMQLFHRGYFQALADVPIVSPDSGQDPILYIAVRAPENTNKQAQWSYQIGVSQNDLVFQWDDRPSAQVVDTDEDSALIVTSNLTTTTLTDYSNLNVSKSPYSLLVYSSDYEHYFSSLNSSWCAIRNGPALITMTDMDTSYTERNGALQQQFFVSGLNSSTKYIAYLLSDFGGKDFGGSIYQPFAFETLESSACELIYDLEFCSRVAYSVPAPAGASKEEIRSKYDDQAKRLYSNFSKAMDQIACNTTNDAIFSPIKTCQDCSESYKDWLCAVTIPRCSTRNITGYQYKDLQSNMSRNQFITDVIKPNLSYYEVLPCLNVCQAIVRACPADFSFSCPTGNGSAYLSYYWDDGGSLPSCNYVGKQAVVTSWAARMCINWALVVMALACVFV